MVLSNFQIILIFLMIFDTYILYRYMMVIYDVDNTVNRVIEIGSYVSFYFILVAIDLFAYSPYLLFAYNILAVISLSYNYQSTLKKRILSSFLIFTMQILPECLGVVLFDIIKLDLIYRSICIAIILRILNYLIVSIFSHYYNLKKDINLPSRLWVPIVLNSFASIISYILLVFTPKLYSQIIEYEFALPFVIKSNFKNIASIFLLVTSNLSLIFIFKELSTYFAEKYNQKLVYQQNEYYNNQFELMKNSLKLRNAEKHDLKNHLSAIETLLYMDEKSKAIEHISTMMELCTATKEYSASGNINIDSILNYKIQEAEQNEIAFNLELCVPEHLNISSFDMTVILGNIIDNAINATKNAEKEKIINLIIKYNKGRLFIKIDNTFNGEIRYGNNRLITLNKDKENHGIGLNNVRSNLEKYNGTMEIEHSDGVFSVTIIMFV